ncbi:hypothetical protein BDV96DRAFT_501636 [Lophiotrema nucula]|uniref:DUF7729 domain-containing protein n=1 Tax=Lophiotrema nucula TaxID=690887 RepID=A0A6A5YSJ8_9PLEO|nr:hypothetical protein BDV96DRAFT_501636 [Lophiotrema nucula]
MHQRRDGSPTTASSTKTSIGSDPSATASDFAIPRPFDTALSNNFTSPCATFFKTMLSDSGFGNCHPFSLMLQTSSGLFDSSKSVFAITRVLEATCSVNSDQCTKIMDGFARDLVSDANCQVDYANSNPQVLQAYNGLVAYEPLYQASCLRDDGGSYCYANAVTNTTATTDAYPYYLPLGVALPGGSRPTCNSCLVDVMAIFSSFGGNATQPISKTYNTAAQQINTYCGPNFVNGSATPLKGVASTTTASFTSTIALFIMLFVLFFQ